MKKLVLTLALLITMITTAEAQTNRNDSLEKKTDTGEVFLPPPPPPLPERVDYDEKSDEIFVVVEEMPEFPGGEAAMMKFIAANIVYPDSAIKNNITGRVVVQFVIDETGQLTEAKIVKGIGYGCDEEALRVMNSMPKWKPGKQRGKPVKIRYVVPIRFAL